MDEKEEMNSREPSENTEPSEKEVKIIPEQGLDTEKYEVSEPWLDGTRVDDSVTGLDIHYDLRGDEVKKALHYFQKRTIYKKNGIFTAILAVIVLIYAHTIYKNPDYTMGYMLLLLSAAVIFFMWFLPARHIRAAAEAVEMAKDSYHIEICPRGLLMPQQDGRYLVGFDRPAVRAFEFSDLYLLVVSKEKVFALPKRCIPEEDQEKLAAMLKEALGARYEAVTE